MKIRARLAVRQLDLIELVLVVLAQVPVWKSTFYGVFVLKRRVVFHAIDATPARWRGDAGSSPLDRAPDALVDFHTGGHGPVQQTRELREPAARGVPDQQHGAVHLS